MMFGWMAGPWFEGTAGRGPPFELSKMCGCPILRASCEGWVVTNLDRHERLGGLKHRRQPGFDRHFVNAHLRPSTNQRRFQK